VERVLKDIPDLGIGLAVLFEVHYSLGELHTQAGQPAEALGSYQHALALYEKLPKEQKTSPAYQQILGSAHDAVGGLRRDTNKPAEAIPAYQQALAVRRKLVDDHRAVPGYRADLSATYHHLASAYRSARRPAEAAATALECKKLWPDNPTELVKIAGAQALCSPLVGKDEAERRKYGDQALETLHQAVAKGFKDAPQLQKDAALAPLRSREEFQTLVRRLAEKEKQAGK
jgi:tetratricopeptide (TPR) repeat protein